VLTFASIKAVSTELEGLAGQSTKVKYPALAWLPHPNAVSAWLPCAEVAKLFVSLQAIEPSLASWLVRMSEDRENETSAPLVLVVRVMEISPETARVCVSLVTAVEPTTRMFVVPPPAPPPPPFGNPSFHSGRWLTQGDNNGQTRLLPGCGHDGAWPSK